MRILVAATVAAFVCACAAPQPAERSEDARLVPMLHEAPQRPYHEVATLRARTEIGEPVQYAYDELRWKAAVLEADAVVKTGERTGVDRTPAPYRPLERPLLGNPYPGPLRILEPGAIPPEGGELKARGRYRIVEGIAIRYLD